MTSPRDIRRRLLAYGIASGAGLLLRPGFAQTAPAATPGAANPHAGHDMSGHAGHDMSGHAGHDMSAHGAAPAADPHAAHKQMMGQPQADVLKRTDLKVVLPSVQVVRQDGTKLPLDRALGPGRPVMVNFLFTTCTTICPVTAQIFEMVRERLGATSAKVNMVSFSIDPEFDTPARLLAYAKKYGADRNWSFYTSGLADNIAIQKAFAAYRGDKMNHEPVTFVRSANATPNWVRIDGLANPDALAGEVRKLLG